MFGPWPGIISNYGCGTFPRNRIIGSGPYNPFWENDFPTLRGKRAGGSLGFRSLIVGIYFMLLRGVAIVTMATDFSYP